MNAKIFLLMSLFSLSCVTSKEQEVTLADGVSEDQEYSTIYEKTTSKYEVIKDFETRIVIHTTVLTPEFRKALSDRYQRIFNEPEPVLEEASNNAGFFITLYTSDKELNDLSNKQLWSVQLNSQNQTRSPVLVKYLSDKPRWRPFFSGISPWSREYLVLFEAPRGGIGSSSKMVSENPVKLILSNSDGRITMSW